MTHAPSRRPRGGFAFRRAFAIVSFVLGAAVAPAGAQGAAARQVDGRVVDATGAAVPNAVVVLRNLDTGFERLAHADAQGAFAFAGLGGERYKVTAQAPGFGDAERELGAGDVQALQLALAPAPVVEHVTVVSGSLQDELREALNTRVEVVTAERARDTGYETVGEVLREVPGVVTRRGSETAGAAGEQVQGIESRQVLVLLDGQPLVGARGIKRGVLNLDRQSLARLDRVEVVKGAASALYGSDAIGGVINMVTRDPERPLETAVSVAGGSRGVLDARGSLGFTRPQARGFFSLERHDNDGFDLTPTTPDTTGAAIRRWDALAKASFDLSPSATLTALGNGYWNNSRGRAVGELGPEQDDIDDASQNLGLNLDWRASARTTVKARAYHSRYDETDDNHLLDPAGPALEKGELRQRLSKGDASLQQVLGERQLLQAGVEWWHDEYRGVNRLRDETGNAMHTSVAWLQDRLSLGRRATLTLGLRFDDNSAFGSAWSPKAALNVRLGQQASLRASYGRGFRAPDLGQLYYRFLNPTNFYQVLGNPALRPEHAHSYQAGGEFRLRGGRARLGLNVFRNDVENLIDSVSVGFAATPAQLAAILAREGIDASFRPLAGRLVFTYKNLADVRTQGVEADTEVALGGGFSLYGAYTFLDAKDAATDLLLTNRSRHSGSSRLTWQRAGGATRANLRGTFYSSWLVSRSVSGGVTTETFAPSFSLWDAYLSQRVGRGLEAYAAIDNLTDSQDPNTGLVNSAGQPLAIYRAEVGRTFRLGLRFEWAQ